MSRQKLSLKAFILVLLGFLCFVVAGFLLYSFGPTWRPHKQIVKSFKTVVSIKDEFNKEQKSKEQKDLIVIKDKNNQTKSKPIYVYITGEVKKPGVYKLSADSRLFNLIKKAGGFTKDADIVAVNLAIKLKDEMHIHIPSRKKELNKAFIGNKAITEVNSLQSFKTKAKDEAVININTASLEELKTLPGVGDTIAKRIIEYRKSHGGFKDVNELLNVKGIGQKRFQKIKEKITVR